MLISGRVQGVGYRPFVFNLANQLGISGSVQNKVGNVEIIAQGPAPVLASFADALVSQAPAIARPEFVSSETLQNARHSGFAILSSDDQAEATIHVPPDYFCCNDCIEEINNPNNRRYRYPFTNCTQCGPRYTLINALPYDRPNTSMVDFELCSNCRAEYENPADRRFHAEPIACPDCGPKLFIDHAGERLQGEAALAHSIQLLRDGQIVALQGVGGFHLICDATNAAAIELLRCNKPRPDKPLAVMFPEPGTDQHHWLENNCVVSEQERSTLTAPERPIVLLNKRTDAMLPENIAPGLNEIGAILPYSPLHHILLNDFAKPLIATSGNISGEPVLTDSDEAQQRLAHITPHILWHNRPIVRPADDSVMRTSHGKVRPLRLGRGMSPVEWKLPFYLAEPVIAVGAHMKLTVALAWENRLVVSPHIADMGSRRSQQIFEQVIEDLQQLYRVTATQVICDRHPQYATSRWARKQALAVSTVAHHHAHASALYGEYDCRDDILVFTWDGTGLGSDDTLWGGETFYGRPGQWQRVAQLRPYRLPGGDKVAHRPWQSAAAVCWEAGIELPDFAIAENDSALLQAAWQQQLNTVTSSSMGRLFDAASALIEQRTTCSFDGQAPMLLEAQAQSRPGSPWEIVFTTDSDRLMLDWSPWLSPLMDDTQTAQQRSADFHTTLAHAILRIVERLEINNPQQQIGLCGGVFQNRLLTDQAAQLLEGAGYEVLLPRRVPCNDGAISFGQIMEFGYQNHTG